MRCRTALAVAVMLLTAHVVCLHGAGRAAGPPLARDAAALRLDPNIATADELVLLPAIGPTLAARIVAFRESCGRSPAFSCAEDLDLVRGIGPATIAKFAPLLCFPEPPPDADSTAASPP